MKGFFENHSHSEFHDLEANYGAYLPKSKDGAILDVGCSYGRFISYAQKQGYKNTYGIDIDREAVDWVNKNLGDCATHHEDVAAFLKEHPESYDLIVLKDVIYYFAKPKVIDFIDVIKNALRPGGAVVVEAYNGAAFTGPFVSFKDPWIEWIPTEHLLQFYLQQADLKNVNVRAHKSGRSSPKRRVFEAIQSCWQFVLRCIYFIERGMNDQNPKILAPKIVASGTK